MRHDGHAAGESTARPDAAPAEPSIVRALGLTLGAQVVVAAGTLMLYRLLARNTGTDGFASFSLVRQAVTLLFPVVTVGLVGGLPRAIALAGRPSSPAPEAYLAAAAAICGSVAAAAAALALLLPEATAAAFFGDADATELVAPFAALLGATAAFYVA